jgi:hypothetical protein
MPLGIDSSSVFCPASLRSATGATGATGGDGSEVLLALLFLWTCGLWSTTSDAAARLSAGADTGRACPVEERRLTRAVCTPLIFRDRSAEELPVPVSRREECLVADPPRSLTAGCGGGCCCCCFLPRAAVAPAGRSALSVASLEAAAAGASAGLLFWLSSSTAAAAAGGGGAASSDAWA